MKKYTLLLLFVFVAQACSAGPTPTPLPPTAIPPTPILATPVGYGVEFPFSADEIVQELGANVYVTCEQEHSTGFLDSDLVRELVAAGGKLNTTLDETSNITYLWSGNVPLELFYEPPAEEDLFGIYYDYSSTSYCVSGLEEDVNGWGAYIQVITKLTPQ